MSSAHVQVLRSDKPTQLPFTYCSTYSSAISLDLITHRARQQPRIKRQEHIPASAESHLLKAIPLARPALGSPCVRDGCADTRLVLCLRTTRSPAPAPSHTRLPPGRQPLTCFSSLGRLLRSQMLLPNEKARSLPFPDSPSPTLTTSFGDLYHFAIYRKANYQ